MIKLQAHSYWNDMDDEFTVLSLSYGRIKNYNIDKGFYAGITILCFYIGILVRSK